MIPAERDIARVMQETGMQRLQAIRHLQARAILIVRTRNGGDYRTSRDSAWPLKRANGKTWAE